MQTQHYPPPLHHQDPFNTQAMYAVQGAYNHYSQTGGLDHMSFSRGSSVTYPHQEYHYFPDRGGDPPRLPECSSLSASTASLCATGMAITGNPYSGSDVFHAEGIADYQLQQGWTWSDESDSVHGVHPPPVQVFQQPPVFSTIKSSMDRANSSAVVLSPAAQLPTPAAMAVLLNPDSRSERRLRQAPPQPLAPPVDDIVQPLLAPVITRQVCPIEPELAQSDDFLSREKKHGCTMCHKRFDRPSTLRKHLLVHTGEKAFVCDTCGRRFGVASNLNRHVKKCVLKPVNSALTKQASAAGAHPPSPSSSNTMSSTSSDHASSPSHSTAAPTHGSHSSTKAAPKRRRRAPSPSTWIPPSLLTFNLSPPEAQQSTPVPLPPVRRNLPKEERDSWDENVASSPYHPRGWKNVLPGPGLGLGLGFGGKDVRNLNLGGNGGFMLGRVLVF